MDHVRVLEKKARSLEERAEQRKIVNEEDVVALQSPLRLFADLRSGDGNRFERRGNRFVPTRRSRPLRLL